jgi:hypothetical protein
VEALPVWASLGDAFRVYRLLFQRSVLVAATVYAVIALLEIAHHVSTGGVAQLLALLAFVSTLAGPSLVEGALIEIVRNIHEGRAPESTHRVFAGAAGRLVPLIGASLVYAVGVAFGLLLLIVPGLVILARWSLMPAVVMLERKGVYDARSRSNTLVRGQTRQVLGCVLASFAILVGGSFVILSLNLGFGTETFASFVWSSLAAPFTAHLLTVIYYRRADPGRPVIHPAVLTWKSVWEGR